MRGLAIYKHPQEKHLVAYQLHGDFRSKSGEYFHRRMINSEKQRVSSERVARFNQQHESLTQSTISDILLYAWHLSAWAYS